MRKIAVILFITIASSFVHCDEKMKADYRDYLYQNKTKHWAIKQYQEIKKHRGEGDGPRLERELNRMVLKHFQEKQK